VNLKERYHFLAGYYAGFFESNESFNGEIPFTIRDSDSSDDLLIKKAHDALEKYIQESRPSKTSPRRAMSS
jgi:hypothetical protein